MALLKEIFKQLIVTFFPKLFKKRIYGFSDRINWHNLPAEEAELLLMQFFLSNDSIFFDIGANTGIYTFFAEKYIPQQHIYAFEPIPELNYRLKKMFGQSNIFKLAISDSNGFHKFKIPTIGNHELKSRGKLNTEYFEQGETRCRTIEVKILTLDSFISEQNITKIDFIKIDVEGHELEVIKGGAETLKRLKPVMQIEIEQRHSERDIKEIIEYINNLGYFCYYLDLATRALKKTGHDPKQLQTEKEFKTNSYINNFIFIPDNNDWESRIADINTILSKV